MGGLLSAHVLATSDKDDHLNLNSANHKTFANDVNNVLLSSTEHNFSTDAKQSRNSVTRLLEDYENELYDLALDLASRLLPAFLESKTGLPYPRVSAELANQHIDK